MQVQHFLESDLKKIVECGVARMKVLVAYYSETGNTEKVAKAIYEEVSREHDAHLMRVDEVQVNMLNDYDVVFLGSACHSADLSTPTKRILEGIPHSPKFKLAGFFTHATSSEGFTRWASKCSSSFESASKEKKIDFKGYYNCQGAPSPPVQEFIKKEAVTSTDEYEKYIKEVMKHPTSEDLQKAKKFTREILRELS
jgi:flavodoxin I